MIHALILTGLMAMIQIEAVSVQAVHISYEYIIGVVAPETDSINVSENVQGIRCCLEVPKVITEDNDVGFSTEGWIL